MAPGRNQTRDSALLQCVGCGYSLVGTQSPTCPECGESTDAESIRKVIQNDWSIPRQALPRLVVAALIALVWPLVDAYFNSFIYPEFDAYPDPAPFSGHPLFIAFMALAILPGALTCAIPLARRALRMRTSEPRRWFRMASQAALIALIIAGFMLAMVALAFLGIAIGVGFAVNG